MSKIDETVTVMNSKYSKTFVWYRINHEKIIKKYEASNAAYYLNYVKNVQETSKTQYNAKAKTLLHLKHVSFIHILYYVQGICLHIYIF